MSKSALSLMVIAPALLLAACGSPAPDATPAGDAAPAADVAAAPSPAPAPAAAAPAAAPVDFASLTGDAARGETVFNQCRACHSLDPGTNGVGPSLAGIIGRRAGSVEGYAYSQANKDSGKTWTPEELFAYLESPMRAIPGTKMSFLLANPQMRADVIAYLQSQR